MHWLWLLERTTSTKQHSIGITTSCSLLICYVTGNGAEGLTRWHGWWTARCRAAGRPCATGASSSRPLHHFAYTDGRILWHACIACIACVVAPSSGIWRCVKRRRRAFCAGHQHLSIGCVEFLSSFFLYIKGSIECGTTQPAASCWKNARGIDSGSGGIS